MRIFPPLLCVLVLLLATSRLPAVDPVHWVLHVEHGVEEVRERRGKQKTTGHPLTILLSAKGGKWIDGRAIVPLDWKRPSRAFTSASHAVAIDELPAPGKAPPAEVRVTLGPEATGDPGDPFPTAVARDYRFRWSGSRPWKGSVVWEDDGQKRQTTAIASIAPPRPPGPAVCHLRLTGALGPMKKHFGGASCLLLRCRIAGDGTVSEEVIANSYGGWSVDGGMEGGLTLDATRLTGTIVFQPTSRHRQYDDRFTLEVAADLLGGHVIGSFSGTRTPVPAGEKPHPGILANEYTGHVIGSLRPETSENP